MQRVDNPFFPNLRIEKESSLRIIRLSFRNKELRGFGSFYIGAAIVFLYPVGSLVLDSPVPDMMSNLDMVSALVVGLFLVARCFFPKNVKRAIELDLQRNLIRVLKNNRIEIERPLSQLTNLSIDESPDAAVCRDIRAGDPTRRKMMMEEKQQTLFGWFGPGGAERVALITRYEWPSSGVLYELMQAVYWIIKGGANPVDTSNVKVAGSLKPPLD